PSSIEREATEKQDGRKIRREKHVLSTDIMQSHVTDIAGNPHAETREGNDFHEEPEPDLPYRHEKALMRQQIALAARGPIQSYSLWTSHLTSALTFSLFLLFIGTRALGKYRTWRAAPHCMTVAPGC